MNIFAEKETGEIIKNLYRNNEGILKRINYNDRNYIINDTCNGEVELIFIEDGFTVPEHVNEDNDILTTTDELIEFKSFCSKRKFKIDDNGIAHKVVEHATINDFIKSFKKGSKRAIKNFYDYALTNVWEYFVTLTFREEEIRNNIKMMSYIWKLFTNKLRNKFPNMKAIATYEEFEEGGYHMHAMLSDVDLTLVPARNNKKYLDKEKTNINPKYKKFMYSKFGPQVMNCLDWNFGFNTVVCLKPESNNIQVVNYMSKYMNKCSPAPYGCKRYYKTQNLDARNSVTGYVENNNDLINIIERFNLVYFKTDKAGNKYYRNY